MESEKPVTPRYSEATFLTSASKLEQCPEDSGWEVAFAGRSNAGKSSAINCLTSNKKLARTSKTPGRTQLINFFSLSDQQRLVDLPGYGYAKVPQAIKHEWQKQMEIYLRERQSLRGLIQLMDVRHPLQEFDKLMLNWAHQAEMPVHILLTKADKLKKGPAKSSLLKVQKETAHYGDTISIQLFSSLKNTGLGELKIVLNQWLTDISVFETDGEQPENL